MSLFVLLSSDTNLQAELETCLGGLSPKPTLIQADSFSELKSCLESLSDVDAVLLDTNTFDAPDTFSLPLLLLGDKQHPAYASLARPLHPESLSFAVDELLRQSPHSSDHQNSQKLQKVDFINSLLREVVHDLNNQFTTLRGQLPLLMELYPEENDALTDMHVATEHATRLLHLLEGIDPDTLPDPKNFTFGSFISDFVHFGKKMYAGRLLTDPSEEINAIVLRGDSELLCCLLLQVLWLYQGDAPDLEILPRLQSEVLELAMIPVSPVTDLEKLKDNLSRLSAKHHPGHVSLYLEDHSVVCSLPRAFRF